MNLFDFEKKLFLLLKGNPFFRPFVCNGNPLACEIFIVGFNAATEMKTPFRNFWSSDLGFNKSEWLDTYIRERAEKPLKPHRTRRNKISATRQRIEWITTDVEPIKCLETNLYSKATPEAKDIEKDDRDISILYFLLQSISPKVIFLHGVETRKYFGEMIGEEIPGDQVVEVNLFGNRTKIIAKQHLSRGWSKEKSKNFAKEILTLL